MAFERERPPALQSLARKVMLPARIEPRFAPPFPWPDQVWMTGPRGKIRGHKCREMSSRWGGDIIAPVRFNRSILS